MRIVFVLLLAAGSLRAAAVPFDATGVRPGPVKVSSSPGAIVVSWDDADALNWKAEFSLDPEKPLLSSISANGEKIVQRATPLYWCETGTREGGWDQFFDFPPSHAGGTRRFQGVFKLTSARAKSSGSRVDLTFDGLQLGIFKGSVQYLFYPGGRLIQQRALVRTDEPNVAFYYEAGLKMAADADVRAGGNMDSHVSYFDTAGTLRSVPSEGPERNPAKVRYRAIGASSGAGSVAVFPSPHRFFFPRDFTTNLGTVWHSSFRGFLSLGIRQVPDDNWVFYPWFNAPPGTTQELDMFLLPDPGPPSKALANVLRYTHGDRFPAVAGYKTLAPHWHLAYTVQAMEKGYDWIPPFKPVLEAMGIDMIMPMDFHGDGHPLDTTELRLRELKAYFDATRAQSDSKFLIIPSEEIHQYFGGHWAVAFPKPVYWFMKRGPGEPFQTRDPKYGTVYRVGSAEDMRKLVHDERGFVYQAHPRTKGSTGFPDQIRDSAQLKDAAYFGAGWKAMNADLSSPRLGDRSFRTLDDLNNWGLHKRLLGEVDVFQIESTHELYAHMNANYVHIPDVPAYGRYGDVLEAIGRGDFFTTTGEVLILKSRIAAEAGDSLDVSVTAQYTFPLRFAEIVWGDGAATHTETFPLDETGEFGRAELHWSVRAKGWKWARAAVWDIAADGAFINPVWKEER